MGAEAVSGHGEGGVRVPTGPHEVALEITGPYQPTGEPANCWWYREKGHIQFHLQADGLKGLMHYKVRIPTRAPKPTKKEAP